MYRRENEHDRDRAVTCCGGRTPPQSWQDAPPGEWILPKEKSLNDWMAGIAIGWNVKSKSA